MMHVRANREDEERVSQAPTQKAKAGGIQAGHQGTMWGGRRVRHGGLRKVGELKQYNNYRLLR